MLIFWAPNTTTIHLKWNENNVQSKNNGALTCSALPWPCWHIWVPVELFALYLLMTWLLPKASGWILKCLSQGNIICSYSVKCLRTHWTALQNLKHITKSTQYFFKTQKWNVMQRPSQSPDLNPIEHAFKCTCWRQNWMSLWHFRFILFINLGPNFLGNKNHPTVCFFSNLMLYSIYNA